MFAKAEALIYPANLSHNLDCVRRLAPASRVLAVVKADAYGHGLVALLDALKKADALAVAHIGEAIELREHSPKQIVILEGFLDAAEWTQCLQYDLTPVLHMEEQLRIMRATPPPTGFAAWIKLDTGMHRLGFAPADLSRVKADLLATQAELHLTAMTHFARSEESGHVLTAQQIDRFDAANHGTQLPASLANSAAIVDWPRSHRDWVRPGLMLYGIAPSSTDIDLRPAMTLQSRVIALREVLTGDEVGYNGRWRAKASGRIATVAIGYADGYPSQLPDGTPVLIRGRQARLAGRPSMDMITVDVSDIPEVCVGDNAVLWGEGLPLEQVAGHAQTLSYQLLTGVGNRVRRILSV